MMMMTMMIMVMMRQTMMTMTQTNKEICSVSSDGKRRGGGVGGKEAKTFENYKTAGAWGDSC